MTHHLTLPPFDYISRPPYIVSHECGDDFQAVTCETLSLAIFQFFECYDDSLTRGCVYRMVDARGVVIYGIDANAGLGNPGCVATDETLRAHEGILGPSESLTNFEMTVRHYYVHLKGGT